MDLEAAKAELKRQREELACQQAVLPVDDDDAHVGAPSLLCFPRVAYNMAAAACRLEDISDTLDPRTNERLHEVKQLLCIALEKQTKSLASRRHATPSKSSWPMAAINGDHSDARTPPMGGDSDGTSSNSSDRPRTKGTKPRQEQGREIYFPSPFARAQPDRR